MESDGLKNLGKTLSRFLGGKKKEGEMTPEDLMNIVEEAADPDSIDSQQKEMIVNIFELADLNAGDIMTHRTDLIALEENEPCRKAIRLSLENGTSRMPVYKKNIDEVVGILHVKDLLAMLENPEWVEQPVSQWMRPVMFVPESCPSRDLLIEFRKKHNQVAIVVDEYGGTAGLVSMEDILEEIVGNIQDEFDNEEELLVPCEGGFVADGSADVEDLFDAMELEMPEDDDDDEENNSVGGLVADKLGRIPKQGETPSIDWGGIRFEVLDADDRRIRKVRCTLAATPAPDEEEKE